MRWECKDGLFEFSETQHYWKPFTIFSREDFTQSEEISSREILKWSNKHLTYIYIQVLYWMQPETEKANTSLRNIKPKTCSDHVYSAYCNEHFQLSSFFNTCTYRVQNRLMVWEFLCRMSVTDSILSTTSSKKSALSCMPVILGRLTKYLGINLTLKMN